MILAQLGPRGRHLQELLGGQLGRADLVALLEVAAHDRRQLDEPRVRRVGAGRAAILERAQRRYGVVVGRALLLDPPPRPQPAPEQEAARAEDEQRADRAEDGQRARAADARVEGAAHGLRGRRWPPPP